MGSSLATALTETVQSRPQCRENSTVTGISPRFRPEGKRLAEAPRGRVDGHHCAHHTNRRAQSWRRPFRFRMTSPPTRSRSATGPSHSSAARPTHQSGRGTRGRPSSWASRSPAVSWSSPTELATTWRFTCRFGLPAATFGIPALPLRQAEGDPGAPLSQIVRTSSERAAAPSLCSSWGSGSRPSGSRDHLGLCDPHNPGAMSFVTPARCEPRPRGHLRPVRTRVGAIAVIPARGDKRDSCEVRGDTCVRVRAGVRC